ncbi:hypothetical protein [Amphiplicatus metriothermophilus]|uniref:Uncharacterized protein n=1 Tax=Amphiplicatus metriothermophilus TaxID=1519374 RepID=A0A239PLI9_9PROT|nr:hypothetical protein [Amphiplicatus metriothermophilus]MBB5517712.1 hypothetical protein [Amphiplicatus metriothermophilus]SNT67954.1 hypothetical protein SAMN06297382_0449 [Amphiplicatus metriothermophilus]
MNRSFALGADHTTRAWAATAAFMLALAVVITPAALVDKRTLWEISVWAKPLKFCVALTIHFATLALLAQLLDPRRRAGPVMRGAVYLSVGAALFEIVYIAVQAARGRHSHFNTETAFEIAMYQAMGIGALMLMLAPFVLGLALARERGAAPSGLRLGAIAGLLLAPALTVPLAGYMSISGSHWVGAAVSDAGGVPLFGWSREVGDLRPAHFVATHVMQALPLVGLAADRLAARHARAVVLTAAAALSTLALGLFAQALSGAPIWPR